MAIILAGCQTTATFDPNAKTFDTSHYHTGVTTVEKTCAKGEFTVWVTVDGDGFCLRYFPSFAANADHVKQAVVFFHGDLSYTGAEKAYSVLKAEHLAETSGKWGRALDLDYIWFSRPGTFGSTGFHPDRRYRDGREGRIVNAALDAISKRHGISTLHLAGHSGGANVVAQALEYRRDVKCAVMAAGAMSMQDAYQKYAFYPDFQAFIGTKYDPYDHIARLQQDAKRRLFILYDPADQIVGAGSSTSYAKAVGRLGHKVILVKGTARGDTHHDMDNTARYMAGDCANSMTNDEIARRAKNRQG